MSARGLDGFSCPVCDGGPRKARYRSADWSVVECASCGLWSTWPRPTPEQLSAIYASADYYGERDMSVDAGAETAARASDLLSHVGGGPLLDYGAGSGHLVQGAHSLGVEADGVEPSESGRRLARELYGVELLAELPADARGHYQGVTLIHVLEHVPDPVQLLRELGGVLVDGGRILIEVPHAGSTRYLPPGMRRAVYDLPAHLFHFTPRTLGDVVTRAGLTVESVRLFNPWVLERLLEHRRPAAAAEPAPEGVADAAPAPAPQASGGARSAWRRLLPHLRERVPGEKFQFVVRGR